jgi:hypothetical protein
MFQIRLCGGRSDVLPSRLEALVGSGNAQALVESLTHLIHDESIYFLFHRQLFSHFVRSADCSISQQYRDG